MAETQGYAGTIQVETNNVARIFFGLTGGARSDDWVKIAGKRAWFTMNLEGNDRPFYLAQLSLLKQAMSEGLHVEVQHGGAVSWHYREAGDTFECTSVRIFRAPMKF